MSAGNSGSRKAIFFGLFLWKTLWNTNCIWAVGCGLARTVKKMVCANYEQLRPSNQFSVCSYCASCTHGKRQSSVLHLKLKILWTDCLTLYLTDTVLNTILKSKATLLKSIHWVNSSARSSFFEKGIILTKPFQPSQSWHQLSFFEKGIIVQNFLLSRWALEQKCFYWK